MANGPLTKQHLADINEALATLDEAEAQIKLAKQAGFDVAQQEQQAKQQRAQLLKIKQTYFPGK